MNARVLALVVLLSSCGGTYYVPTDTTVGSMNPREARNVFATELKGSSVLDSGSPVLTADVRATSRRLIVTDVNGKQHVFVYRDLPAISVGLAGPGIGWTLVLGGQPVLSLGFAPHRDYVPNALHVLQQDALRAQKRSDEFNASFAASLTDYRNKAASGTAIPEEANKYKVQAEGAVRDKDFDDAADLYAAALKVAPWWPAGHFNRALVLGELEDYAAARREMGYYLQLVPEAANARAAQDKIYQWERLEAK